ncbi:hypothetical protein CBM2585_A130107 [Cupriavidus taiwanensis]|nr:hypothetical protein CBM2585_A130107 [Cupriavidus taiwanensis]
MAIPRIGRQAKGVDDVIRVLVGAEHHHHDLIVCVGIPLSAGESVMGTGSPWMAAHTKPSEAGQVACFMQGRLNAFQAMRRNNCDDLFHDYTPFLVRLCKNYWSRNVICPRMRR